RAAALGSRDAHAQWPADVGRAQPGPPSSHIAQETRALPRRRRIATSFAAWGATLLAHARGPSATRRPCCKLGIDRRRGSLTPVPPAYTETGYKCGQRP